MLELHDVTASYGVKQILFGVNLTVGSGEVVTLMGRNGMGKTTTINSILGFMRASGGGIQFENQDIRGWPAYRIARAGIGLVPEGRQIFSNLTVRENLIATAAKAEFKRGSWSKKGSWSLSDVYRLFPRLEERQSHWGWQLSGGEQQMLAIGRALLTNPQLLILDEATEGVAPLVRKEIWDCLSQVKDRGQAILVVDKNLDILLKMASRHYILEKGTVAWSGTSAELAASPGVYERYLGV